MVRRIVISPEEYQVIIKAAREAVESHPEFRGWCDLTGEVLPPDPWDKRPDALFLGSAYFTGPDRNKVDVVSLDKYKGIPFWGSPNTPEDEREYWDRELWHISIHSEAREHPEHYCSRCRKNLHQ